MESKSAKTLGIAIIILSMLLLSLSLLYAQSIIGDAEKIETAKYSLVYKNITQIVPIYKTMTDKDVPYSCYDSGKEFNVTCKKDITYDVIDSYKEVVIKSYPVGITDGSKETKGYFNIDNDKIYQWKYDQKDRNYQEFGKCRDFEKDKGVCYEVQ